VASVCARQILTLATITNVWIFFAFVHIRARLPIWHEDITSITTTLITTWLVDAPRHATTVAIRTLFLIQARCLLAVGLISIIADTLKTSHKVLTLSIGADATLHGTLIKIFACFATRHKFVAIRALAVERADCVDALTTTTKARVSTTFIDIHAHHHHHGNLKAFKAFTSKPPWYVNTRAVPTWVFRYPALINVCTVRSIVV
jgi:hypothetical protein